MARANSREIVRVGQTKATIYQTPSRGCLAYTVCWYEGANRRRKAFHDYAAARLHAASVVAALSRGETEVIRLSGEQRLEYTRAREAIAEFGVSLDTAAHEYRDAKRLLNGASLLDAARQFASSRGINLPEKSVADVFGEMLQAKRDAGLSQRYVTDLKQRLGDFAKDFQCSISRVTGAQIRTWLQAKDVSNRTRNNSRISIQTLFSFAIAQKYLPRDWNEMEAVPPWKTVGDEVEIFTPGEIERLLVCAGSTIKAFIAIGAFAGLRSAEIERLDWKDIDFSSGYIRVAARHTKTGSRRLVPLLENLRAWLLPIARQTGPVVEIANLPNAIQRLIAAVNRPQPNAIATASEPHLQWRHNGLRHSFCSYRLAIVKNAAQVALEAGNSPSIIFEHYRELVTEDSAKQWFNVLPR